MWVCSEAGGAIRLAREQRDEEVRAGGFRGVSADTGTVMGK